MNLSLFEHEDYKEYLRHWCRARPQKGWGTRSAIAKAAGCQVAYVSQVLNGALHFSLEQAQPLSILLGHGSEEATYFLLLVQKARAGSAALRKHFQDQLEELKQKRFVLKHQLGVAPHLEKENQMTYYSSWTYAAVHVLVDIPEFQTKEMISRRLDLSLQRVADILDFLVSAGLVVQVGNLFQMSKKSIHLGSDSAFISKHHTNWRIRAITSIDQANDEALHYSSVITLSRSDYRQVKARLVDTIKELKAKVRESKEEGVYCFALDIFEL